MKQLWIRFDETHDLRNKPDWLLFVSRFITTDTNRNINYSEERMLRAFLERWNNLTQDHTGCDLSRVLGWMSFVCRFITTTTDIRTIDINGKSCYEPCDMKELNARSYRIHNRGLHYWKLWVVSLSQPLTWEQELLTKTYEPCEMRKLNTGPKRLHELPKYPLSVGRISNKLGREASWSTQSTPL